MAERSMVAVFAVDERGATGEQVGWALLVEPGLVLAIRPLNEELAGRPRPLRTGIRWTADVGVDVIDVDAVHVLDDAKELVLLSLAHASLVEPTPLSVGLTMDPDDFGTFVDPSRAQVVDALRALLDEVASPDPAFEVADPILFIRRVLGLHP
jgi:hypothetical protein